MHNTFHLLEWQEGKDSFNLFQSIIKSIPLLMQKGVVVIFYPGSTRNAQAQQLYRQLSFEYGLPVIWSNSNQEQVPGKVHLVAYKQTDVKSVTLDLPGHSIIPDFAVSCLPSDKLSPFFGLVISSKDFPVEVPKPHALTAKVSHLPASDLFTPSGREQLEEAIMEVLAAKSEGEYFHIWLPEAENAFLVLLVAIAFLEAQHKAQRCQQGIRLSITYTDSNLPQELLNSGFPSDYLHQLPSEWQSYFQQEDENIFPIWLLLQAFEFFPLAQGGSVPQTDLVVIAENKENFSATSFQQINECLHAAGLLWISSCSKQFTPERTCFFQRPGKKFLFLPFRRKKTWLSGISYPTIKEKWLAADKERGMQFQGLIDFPYILIDKQLHVVFEHGDLHPVIKSPFAYLHLSEALQSELLEGILQLLEDASYKHKRVYGQAVRLVHLNTAYEIWAEAVPIGECVPYPSHFLLLFHIHQLKRLESTHKPHQSLTPIAAMQKEYAYVKALLDNTEQTFLLINREMQVVSFNSFANKLSVDLTQNHLTPGTPVLQVVAPGMRKEVERNIYRAFGGETVQGEKRVMDLDGRARWFRFTYTPVVDPGFAQEFVSFSTLETTDLNQTRAILEEQEDIVQSVFNTADIGFGILDLSGGILRANRGFCQLYSYQESELQGQGFSLLFPEEIRRNAHRAFLAFIQQDETERQVWETTNKFGKRIFVHITMSKTHAKSGEGYVIITLRDVTEAHLAERQLLEQNAQLKKINNELDRFVYSVSHDLRAPVVSVLGLVNLARMEPKTQVDDYYLSMIEDGMYRLDRFIRDIIDYSTNSRLDILSEEVCFAALLEDIREHLKMMDGYQKVNIILEEKIECPAISDPNRIKVLLKNLLSNAIRYRCNLRDSNFAKIIVETNPQQITLQVTDNGQGIEPEHQSKVFDMFYRGTVNNHGSGLGLYILRETVNTMNGNISLVSEPKKGSTFTIYLPNNPLS